MLMPAGRCILVIEWIMLDMVASWMFKAQIEDGFISSN
eukprot:SAG31_NODE_33775_length_340_cov_0.730290_1_plen_37_part_10